MQIMAFLSLAVFNPYKQSFVQPGAQDRRFQEANPGKKVTKAPLETVRPIAEMVGHTKHNLQEAGQ